MRQRGWGRRGSPAPTELLGSLLPLPPLTPRGRASFSTCGGRDGAGAPDAAPEAPQLGLPTLPVPGSSLRRPLLLAVLPALAARGHQGASDIRLRAAPKVRAALSQGFSGGFASRPSPRCGGGEHHPWLPCFGTRQGWGHSRWCPSTPQLELLSRAVTSPSLRGRSLASISDLSL